MKASGFDGVQLHAAHGGLLSCFLSPYTNRRTDEYGGSTANRARIVREIVARARAKVGDWPILIKANCTDYVKGGMDIDTFPRWPRKSRLAAWTRLKSAAACGTAWSGPRRNWDFGPSPRPNRTRASDGPKSKAISCATRRACNLEIPVILVGGNRNIERLEEIVRGGRVDFVALCRPLIREPDLPNRWLEGRGGKTTRCISCNSCIYNMIVHPAGRSLVW